MFVLFFFHLRIYLQKSIYKARKLREANNADVKDYLKDT